VIGSRSKLDFKMNYMIIRKDFETTKVYIDEIYMLIIESTAVSLTAVLLNELIKKKVAIVFCDEKRNPTSEVLPLHGSHNCSKRCREQAEWSKDLQAYIWPEIVRHKIMNQADLLQHQELAEAELLYQYLEELTLNDETQREGHAAKVYFNALFGKSFSREQDNPINAALNYGYAILLSAVNREILSLGYITQLGLNHCNQFNPYNLGSDLMEPLRGFVDAVVIKSRPTEFDRNVKLSLIELLSEDVKINDTVQTFSAAIRIYCKSVFDALRTHDANQIRFIEYEL
ncbi:MAG: type II CRISPR-associated endonuclease Cas1, partial [Veillonella sp.]|nr:type II CRISPR-associated endonuclease Cas1 [Veillonella sp.]